MEFISHIIELKNASSGTFSTDISFDGEHFDLAITAHEPIELKTCKAVFHHEFDIHTRLLVNGYQSWTKTEERRVFDRDRDLSYVPNRVIDHFALDAMGDYRFMEHDRRIGCFHGTTYATIRANRQTNEVILLASLDESHGFTLISVDARANTVTMQTECPKRPLKAGERVILAHFAFFKGAIDTVFDRYFELMGIKARPAKPICGYTSWYRHYDAIDEDKLISDLASTTIAFDELNTRGFDRVFQIDDGWCKVGDWSHIDTEKFPHGLATLAKAAKECNLLPGLWMAPFVCEQNSLLASEHPDWLLRDKDGNPVTTGVHWSGGLALNTCNDEVREYVRSCIRTVVHEWGFRLLKLDFLYAACMICHDGLNRGQLMEDAMTLLRDAAGKDCKILGCGVPLASAFGRVEYCRIGCDVGPDWNDKFYMRPLHLERVSTKHSITNTISRSPLNMRAFLNDPDVCFINDDIQLNKTQRNTLLNAAAKYAGMLLTSDDMSKWTKKDIERYQDALRAIAERCQV